MSESDRIPLNGISARAWQHPSDLAALRAVRKVPGFDLVVKKVFAVFSERALRVIAASNAVEAGPEQHPDLYALYLDVLATFDTPSVYPLYVSAGPELSAGAMGIEHPFIVLGRDQVEAASPEALRFLLGREVGHILSDHVVYKTLLRLLTRAGIYLFFNIPLTGIAFLAVVSALLEWDRKSELSADRAAALGLQDPAQVRETMLWLSGGAATGEGLEAFLSQSHQIEQQGSVLDSFVKTLALLGTDHSFPVLRMAELDRWLQGPEYAAVLEGAYPRREDDQEDSVWIAWKQSLSSYAQDVRSNTEPVGDWIRDVGSSATHRIEDAFGWLRDKWSAEEADKGET